MALRIRADTANFAVGLEPLSQRAVDWLQASVVPLGGGWKTVGGVIACWLLVEEIPADLLASSGLELHFGDMDSDPVFTHCLARPS